MLNPNNNDEVEQDLYNILEKNFIVDVPDYRRVQLKYESLFFEEASYQSVRWTIPIDQIARYYQLHRILAYVYSSFKHAALVLLASERVIYNYLGLNRKLVYEQLQAIPVEVRSQASILRSFLVREKYYEDFEDLRETNPLLFDVWR